MPTSGRLTLAGTFDALLAPGQEVLVPQPGPLGRRVEDLAAAMTVLQGAGADVDLDASPAPPLEPGVGAPIAGLRVGFCLDDGWFPPSPACRRAVREAAAALEDRGAIVEEFSPPGVAEAMELFFGLMSAAGPGWARRLGLGPLDPRLRELLVVSALPHPANRLLAAVLEVAGQPRRARVVRAIGRRSTAEYWKLVARRRGYCERFLGKEGPGRFDAWILPPSPTPALRHGASRYLLGAASYTILPKVLGVPAGVVAATRVRPDEEAERDPSRDPVERTAREVDRGSAGLPVGVQVVAPRWREDTALRIMAALESHFRAQPDYPDCPPL